MAAYVCVITLIFNSLSAVLPSRERLLAHWLQLLACRCQCFLLNTHFSLPWTKSCWARVLTDTSWRGGLCQMPYMLFSGVFCWFTLVMLWLHDTADVSSSRRCTVASRLLRGVCIQFVAAAPSSGWIDDTSNPEQMSVLQRLQVYLSVNYANVKMCLTFFLINVSTVTSVESVYN